MTTVKKSIVINATREEIRPVFSDPQSVKERDPNIYHYQPDDNWPAVGAKNEMGFKTIAFNVDSVATSLEYDPQTMRLVYQTESKNLEPSTWRWTFDEQDGKTTVTMQVDYTLPGSYLGKVLDKLVVERQNAKQAMQGLEALKVQVERSL